MKEHPIRALSFAALAVVLLGGAASAQIDDEHALSVQVQGGGFSATNDLDDPGRVSFDNGWNVGAGIGYQINRYLALRGNFVYAQADLEDLRPAPSLAGNEFNRFFYDADFQLRYPFASGLSPYVLAGGGLVTIEPDDVAGQSFTKGAGKVGVGLSYVVPDSGFEIYAQGTGWLYEWDRLGFDETQFDTTWSAGLGYRFGGR